MSESKDSDSTSTDSTYIDHSSSYNLNNCKSNTNNDLCSQLLSETKVRYSAIGNTNDENRSFEFSIQMINQLDMNHLFGDSNKPADYVLVYETNNINDVSNGLQQSGIKIKIDSIRDRLNTSDLSEKERKRNIYLANLHVEGLELRYYKRIERRKQIVYIFVHTPDHKLCEAAEKTRFKVKIKDCDIESPETLCNTNLTNPFKLDDGLSDNYRRRYISIPYTSKLKHKIEEYSKKPFAQILLRKDRSLLTYEFLSQISFSEISEISTARNGKFGIERLLDSGIFTAAYPPHGTLSQELDDSCCLDEYNIAQQDHESENHRQILWKYWAKPSNMFKFQPLHHIKEYFGEKVAFYFAWLGFYTTWLFVPSIVGVFVFLYGLVTLPFDIPTSEICDKNGIGNLTMCRLCTKDACDYWKLSDSCLYSRVTHIFDNAATVFFSVVMAIWTVLFIEFWKRKQNELQYEWDVVDFEDKYDTVRPDYERLVTQKRENPITKKIELYVPYKERFLKYLTSISAVLFMVSLVVALLFAIILYRITVFISLSRRWGRITSSYFSSITAATINLIFIFILNQIYTRLATTLTRLELHRTDSSYETSFTIKMYLFQFVNYYSSIFYVAFFKGWKKDTTEEGLSNVGWYYEPCDPSGCLVELCIQLATIMVGKQIINNITEKNFPKIMRCVASIRGCGKGLTNNIQELLRPNTDNNCSNSDNAQAENMKGKLHPWEKDYKLMDWTSTSLFYEYLEMVLQFGFITLFVVAFPLGPLCAFLNNIIEIRIDSYKVLIQSKRPLAKKAQSIGIWLNILNTVSRIGVITNGFIIAFTSEFIPRLVYLISQQKPNLTGYVNYTLLEHHTSENEICMYRGYEPKDMYHILVGRLAFIVCFEHFTFFLVTALHWVIPDVPKIIKDKIENENSIAQRIIWQTSSEPNIPNLFCESISKERNQKMNNIPKSASSVTQESET